MARRNKRDSKPLPPMTSCCSICAKEFQPNAPVAYKDGWGWFCAEHAYNGFNFSGTLEEYLQRERGANVE